MTKPLYTFTVKRTPRGKYYIIVTIGRDVIYVTRKAYPYAEQAHVEAREYLENRSITHEHEHS